ncbi:flagellar hook-length control protein FliK [Piscirickettsia salmonis]|uniref:flagellar hook-length control protein FliK n=1 Tax=Piscirickettsia salmonis TaxID=1238 RepID=UPI0011873C4F|nr:flagellar hook-length control protein FliK [Piscirickettsia salmonis]QHS24938.1 flagellar hook-length control protein FliK [Piscirickettsia salmonis]QHS28145.1 flagellar hook-length control protein FliK [Piscirickettsia salmonis]
MIETGDFSALVSAALTAEGVEDSEKLAKLAKVMAVEELPVAFLADESQLEFDDLNIPAAALDLNLSTDLNINGLDQKSSTAKNFIISLQQKTLNQEGELIVTAATVDDSMITIKAEFDQNKEDIELAAKLPLGEDLLDQEDRPVEHGLFINNQPMSAIKLEPEKALRLGQAGNVNDDVVKITEENNLTEEVMLEKASKIAQLNPINNGLENNNLIPARREDLSLLELAKKSADIQHKNTDNGLIEGEFSPEKLNHLAEQVKTEILPKPQGVSLAKLPDSYITNQWVNSQFNIASTVLQQERIQPSVVQHFDQPIPLMDEAELAPALGQRLQIMLNRQLNNATIALDPPELGPLMIKLHVDASQKTHLTFTTHSDVVREMIEQQLPRLKDMFDSQGLALGDANVAGQGTFSQGQHFNEEKEHNKNNMSNAQESADVLADEHKVEPAEGQYIRDLGVDLFA